MGAFYIVLKKAILLSTFIIDIFFGIKSVMIATGLTKTYCCQESDHFCFWNLEVIPPRVSDQMEFLMYMNVNKMVIM